MSDSSVIIVDLDVRGEREATRLADALKRWLHQQELTADIDTGRQVFAPNANCGTVAVCPRCSNTVSDWVDIANDILTAWVEYRGEDGVACPPLRSHQPRLRVGMARRRTVGTWRISDNLSQPGTQRHRIISPPSTETT